MAISEIVGIKILAINDIDAASNNGRHLKAISSTDEVSELRRERDCYQRISFGRCNR